MVSVATMLGVYCTTIIMYNIRPVTCMLILLFNSQNKPMSVSVCARMGILCYSTICITICR